MTDTKWSGFPTHYHTTLAAEPTPIREDYLPHKLRDEQWEMVTNAEILLLCEHCAYEAYDSTESREKKVTVTLLRDEKSLAAVTFSAVHLPRLAATKVARP